MKDQLLQRRTEEMVLLNTKLSNMRTKTTKTRTNQKPTFYQYFLPTQRLDEVDSAKDFDPYMSSLPYLMFWNNNF